MKIKILNQKHMKKKKHRKTLDTAGNVRYYIMVEEEVIRFSPYHAGA